MRQYLIAMFLAGCACAVNGQNDCLTGFSRWGPSCYKFGDSTLTFDNAVTYCKNLNNSRLVFIESEDENSYLKSQLIDLQRTGSFWMGLTNLREKTLDKWRWYGYGREVSVTDWENNEPNNYNGGGEECVEFRHGFDYRWNDIRCSETNYPICELQG